MKIHTTQNLSTLVKQPTNLCVSPKDFRLNQQLSEPENEPKSDSISFKRKFKPNGKSKKVILNKVVGATKEKADKIKKANDKVKQGNAKDPVGGVKNRFLEWTNAQEVMIQSVISLLLCTIARPLTLVAMGNDKTKNDMAYASAHSISSGLWGFIVPLTIIFPMTRGYQLAVKEGYKYLSVEQIKKRYPHWNEKTNVVDGKILPFNDKNSLDIHNNKFIADTKDVFKVPLPKHLSEISKETKNQYIDESTGKLKTIKDIFIAVAKESDVETIQKERSLFAKIFKKKVVPNYYPLEFIKEDLLKNLYPDLDIKTIEKNGKRVLPHEWKTKDGKPFNFDMDTIYISNWDETNKAVPLITGDTYTFTDKKGTHTKETTYQKNGTNGKLGSPISKESLDASLSNAVQDKLGGWLGDIIIAYPRATATIAIIPFVLKKVFHLEKHKKTEEPPKTEPVNDARKEVA